jgi:Skp family chaperone for outer membrane proteins
MTYKKGKLVTMIIDYRIIAFTLINVLAFNLYAQQAGIKIAYVDMEIVFQSYYKTISADEMIKKQTEIYKEYAMNLEKEREILEKEFNVLRDDSQNIAFSDETRDDKRNQAQTKFMLLQEKKKDIQDYQQEKRLNLRKQYEDQRAKIVKELSDFIKNIAEQEGFDLVVDSSGNTLNGIPVFVYYKTDFDITDTVVKTINKGHENELKPMGEAKEGNPANPLAIPSSPPPDPTIK